MNNYTLFFEKNHFPVLEFIVLPGYNKCRICKIINANENAEEYLGYSKKELLKMKPTDLEVKGKYEPLEEILGKYFSESNGDTFRRRIIRKDDEEYEAIGISLILRENKKNRVFLQLIPLFDFNGLLTEDGKRILKLEKQINGQNMLNETHVSCMGCGNIKNQNGKYIEYSRYFRNKSPISFSSSYCPKCYIKYVPKKLRDKIKLKMRSNIK